MRVYAYWVKRIFLGLRIWLCSVLHNVIAHPMIPLLPGFISNPFHDWTAKQWEKARNAYISHYLIDEGVDF